MIRREAIRNSEQKSFIAGDQVGQLIRLNFLQTIGE